MALYSTILLCSSASTDLFENRDSIWTIFRYKYFSIYSSFSISPFLERFMNVISHILRWKRCGGDIENLSEKTKSSHKTNGKFSSTNTFLDHLLKWVFHPTSTSLRGPLSSNNDLKFVEVHNTCYLCLELRTFNFSHHSLPWTWLLQPINPSSSLSDIISFLKQKFLLSNFVRRKNKSELNLIWP